MSHEISMSLGAETVSTVERNTGYAALRGMVVLPGSKASSRSHRSYRKLGDPAFGHCAVLHGGPHREGEEPKPMMNGHGKSHIAIVAMKPANKAERSAAELVEPRAVTKGNADQQHTCRTQSRAAAKTAQVCVSQELECYGKTHTAFRRSTFGKSRMRESCTSGSVRGARGNSRPYRDRRQFMTLLGGAAIRTPSAVP